jgi:hypothetical protein
MAKNFPPGYWTLDRCRKDSIQFNSRMEWKNNSGSSYRASIRNGWLDICCSHMEVLKFPKGYWTKEKCHEIALTYSSIKDFRNGNPAAEAAARNHGYTEEITKHMTRRHPYSYYTLDVCQKDALKYETKTEWIANSKALHAGARHNGWLEICYSHMKIVGSRKLRAIYAFEFLDRSVYVGLTYSYEKRYEGHKNDSRWYKRKKDQNIPYIFKRFNEFYPNKRAQIKEAELIDDYRKNGWSILNKNKAGGLGGIQRKWISLDICKKEALRYNSLTEWHKNSNASYMAAKNNGWFEECRKHFPILGMPKGYWTLERCEEEASKFTTIIEWANRSASSYRKALSKGWLDTCTSHMQNSRRKNGYWTLQRCKDDAKKFKHKVDWQRSSGSAYNKATKNGWIKDCCEHMVYKK